jgi:hypothetical protein
VKNPEVVGINDVVWSRGRRYRKSGNIGYMELETASHTLEEVPQEDITTLAEEIATIAGMTPGSL